jgi:hypothetical protein
MDDEHAVTPERVAGRGKPQLLFISSYVITVQP